MERGANAVVGYSLTDAQIFGGIGFAALSPSVYHNKQFSSATYMQQIAHKYVDYFLYGTGALDGEQQKSSDDETPKRETFAIENRLGAPAFGYCSHR